MRYSLTEWEIFLVFFSFLARNGLKFLVSREKSKCEKNGNYSHELDSVGIKLEVFPGKKRFFRENENIPVNSTAIHMRLSRITQSY